MAAMGTTEQYLFLSIFIKALLMFGPSDVMPSVMLSFDHRPTVLLHIFHLYLYAPGFALGPMHRQFGMEQI